MDLCIAWRAHMPVSQADVRHNGACIDPRRKSIVAQVGAMIVSPTRELAKQIHNVALPFVETVPGARAMLLVGGSCAPTRHLPARMHAAPDLIRV